MPSPVTENIYVTYNASANPQFTFADSGGINIPGGDLSAYPGANSFTFYPATGQTWTFSNVQLSLTGTNGGGTVTMASNSYLTIGVSAIANGTNHMVITDTDGETRGEELEYSFTILVNGAYVVCDPKIYNRS